MSRFVLLGDPHDPQKFAVAEETELEPGVYTALTPMWSRDAAEWALRAARHKYTTQHRARRAADIDHQLILDFAREDKENV